MKLGAPAPLPASCPWNFSPARVPALPVTARGFRGSARIFRGILSPALILHFVKERELVVVSSCARLSEFAEFGGGVV